MADDVPISFFPTGGLYLKNLALITIEVRLPEIRNPGVTVSNWEIMEKIKEKSKPEDYQNLRVALSSRELIRFEGEFESVRSLRKVNLLLNGKTIKLRGFPDPLKIRSFQTETPHPKQHQWEEHFSERGVACFEDGKSGERADTVHIKGLPVLWFASKDSHGKPCPKILADAFQKFGKIRQVGFYDPSNDSNHKRGFSSFGPGACTHVLNFEAYIQYEKYSSFTSAMEGLRNVQLLRLQAGGQAMAKIRVDFDRSGFLSDRGIRRRLYLEEKARQEREEEERRLEEEKREEERKKEEQLKIKEREEEERRVKRQEQKRQRKREQEELVVKLKEVAIQRRTEALQLMTVLLNKAAETKLQEEIKERIRQERIQQMREEMKLRNELIQSVQELERRKESLEKELKLRKRKRSSSSLKSSSSSSKKERRVS